jgi:hypothetical protein
MGYRTISAASYKETLDKAIEHRPQAIITDNQKKHDNRIDNLSGLALAYDVSRIPELKETIIFMLTADFIEPVFLWNGGDCFLSKFRTRSRNPIQFLANLVNEYMHH